MGNYLSISDITLRKPDAELVRLTAEAGATAIDESVLSAYIDDAEAEMNLVFMSAGYAVPVVPISEITSRILMRICYDILIYRMYKATYDDYPENIESKQLYIDQAKAREMLTKIGKGELRLPGVVIAETATAPIITNKVITDRLMTSETLSVLSEYESYIKSID